MSLTFDHDGRQYVNWSPEDAAGAGVPQAVIGAALKARAAADVAEFADAYRAAIASASAGKLAEWRIKEEIARDPGAAAAPELALLDREAAARGLDQATLLAGIATKATAYRQTALLIGALEAEASAAISAIADEDAAIESQIETTLSAARAQADTAFAEAIQLIKGGA
jgi:hypothetical protein